MISFTTAGCYGIRGLAFLTLILCFFPATAQELIAHDSVGVDRMTRNEARLYLTMRLKNWPNGASIKVFVLPDDDPLHHRFANGVLGLYPYQLRRVWDRQLFTGTGQAPVTVLSITDMLQRVATTPGAIGYAERGFTHPNIRIIKVQ